MSATSDAWPIYTPTSQSKPLDAILSQIGRGGIYAVADAAELPTLLARLAAAGRPAPAPATPVWAHLADTGALTRNVGAGWRPMAGGTWQTATPSLVNLTLGSGGTATSRWIENAGIADVEFDITLGIGFAVGSSPYVGLPVTPAVRYTSFTPLGTFWCFDVSASMPVMGNLIRSGATASTSLYNGAALSSTSPFVWAVGDRLVGKMRYEVAP